MKKIIKPVIVVEGTSDVNKLCLLVDADFVITNGSEVSRETIEYIRILSLSRQIIVFTDPDYPGQRIRNIINQNVNGCFNAFVEKDKAIKHHKVGVAEATNEAILDALNNMIQYQEIEIEEPLTNDDLYELGLIGQNNSSDKRNYLSQYFHLGIVNGKTLLKRLNMLQIDKVKLKEVLELYENCQ